VPTFTDPALRELGIDEPLDAGAVRTRRERLRATHEPAKLR